MRRLTSLFFYLALILSGVTIPCVVYEIGLRLEHFVRKGTPFLLNPSSRWDKTLGWTGLEHSLAGLSNDTVLVLGDSFTEGLGVPSDRMWFASLKKDFPDKKIIAYGGLGYGTLQELMILRGYLEKGLTPSLIVLQLCSNDIINNYYPLERESYLQRAPGPRPYFEGRDIVVRFPRNYDWILYPLISYSRVAYRYNNRWDAKLATMAQQRKIESVEFRIQQEGFGFPMFREALEVTESLVRQFKRAARKTRIVMVLVDDIPPYTEAFEKISRAYNLPLVVATRDHQLGPEMRLADGTHFNEEGNRMLGDAFVQIAHARHFY